MSLRYELEAGQFNRWQNAVADDGFVNLRPGIYVVTATADIYLGAPQAPTGSADGLLLRAGERLNIENAQDGWPWHVLRATGDPTTTTFTRVVR